LDEQKRNQVSCPFLGTLFILSIPWDVVYVVLSLQHFLIYQSVVTSICQFSACFAGLLELATMLHPYD
jgi:hypothetical protein